MIFDFLKPDRTLYLLVEAIAASDVAGIRKLAAEKGDAILARPLPVYLERTPAYPGDHWLKAKAFKRPRALALALVMADDATVFALEDMGAAVAREVDGNYPNMLFLAAAMGRVQVLERWLPRYPRLALAVNEDRDTLLHIAGIHARPAVAALLLQKGYDAGAKSRRGVTPLHYAERAGHAATMAALRRPHAPAEAAAESWTRVSGLAITRTQDDGLTGYRLTDTFNFGTKKVQRQRLHLATRQASESLIAFDAYDTPARIDEAAARLGLRPPFSS